MKLNSIVVGLGRAGLDIDFKKKEYIKSHTKAYYKHPNFNLLCSIEKKSNQRNLFIKKYKKPSFSNFDINLKEKTDIVSVCVPTSEHKNCIKNIVKLKPKIILCEKPISYSLKDSKDIINICKINKIKLFVNFIRNTNTDFVKLKSKIKNYSDIEGKIYYDNGFLNNASHYFNLMIFLFGNFIGFENVKRINQIKFDINLNVTMKFKNAIVKFIYKKNPLKDIELKNNKFSFKNYKKRFLILDKKKKYNVLDKYQYEVLNAIIKDMKGQNNHYLCSGLQAYNEQLILKKIISSLDYGS